jgi:hypothetical protein
MRYRKLDVNGDYVFGSGSSAFYIDVPEAPAQAVQTRLGLFTGQWFLDTTEGTPWATGVLGKYTQNARDVVIKERIIDTPGVLSLNSFNSAIDSATRRLSVSATITTAYGTAQVQITL